MTTLSQSPDQAPAELTVELSAEFPVEAPATFPVQLPERSPVRSASAIDRRARDPRESSATHPALPATSVLNLLNKLRDPDVRALAALVASPLLIAPHVTAIPTLTDEWRLDSLDAQSIWLQALDHEPQLLRDHLAVSNGRQLGRYAEALWQFWFAHLPDAHLYAAGLAVKDGSAVRGEFDFIVTLPALPGIQHLEMAYKFYMYQPPGDDFSRLFGPNPNDRLDRKWRHMLAAQLPLSQTPLGRSALPEGAEAVIPRSCLQGWLFYPLMQARIDPLAGISPNHWRGWWHRHDPGERAPWSHLADAWTILPRLAWIAPAALDERGLTSPAAATVVVSSEHCAGNLRGHFSRSSVPQLIAGLIRESDETWRETVRIFIVPPTWSIDAAEQPEPARIVSNH